MRQLALRAVTRFAGSGLVLRRSVFQRHDVPVPTEGSVGTWVSDVYPLRVASPLVDGLRWLAKRFRYDFTYHEDFVLRDLREMLERSGVSPCDYFPRFKEGGVLVYFNSLADAQKGISYFNTHKFRGRRRSVFLLEGTPFLEDMLHLTPTPKVRITPASFKAILPVTEEELYTELRVYGTLKKMEMDPKMEFAVFTYRSEASAISARICLHMKEIAPKQFIRVSYESYSRFAWISKMLSNPRVTVPVIAIGGTILSYLLIDPVRLLNVVRTLTSNEYESVHGENLPSTPESEALAKSLSNAPSGAGVLLVGPREARDLALEKVTRGRWFVISIDLTPEGSNKVSDSIQELSNQIGFVPSFNQLSRMFDYFQAMIPGSKAATAQGNVEEQLQAILKVLSMALKIVSRTYPADGRPFPYALVLLDFKSTLSEAGNPAVVPLMQQWALEMMRLRIAHVVVAAESRHLVTADSTQGALRNHAYVTHPVHDLSRDIVRNLLQPLFDVPPDAEPPLVPADPVELDQFLLLEQGYDLAAIGRRHSESMFETSEPQSAPEKTGFFGSILPRVFGGFGGGGEDPDDAAVAFPSPPPPLPPPPPPPPPPVSAAASSSSEGWWQRVSGVLEKVVLRRSRNIFDRYAGKEKASQVIPMDGFSLETLSEVVYSVLGGRLPDIVRFVYRVSSTRRAPLTVLLEMESEAQAEILNRSFGKKLFVPASPGAWTQPQAWKCIKAIASASPVSDAADKTAAHAVSMDQLLLSVFKGDKSALQALVATGVLRVEESARGELILVAGSPLYLNTFRHMARDPTLRRGMEAMVLDAEYGELTTEALRLEEDLAKLSSVCEDMEYGARVGVAARKAQVAARLGELAQLVIKNRNTKASL